MVVTSAVTVPIHETLTFVESLGAFALQISIVRTLY